MLSYAEPEERDRIAELRRRTAAAAPTDDDEQRVAALRLKAAAAASTEDDDLQRVEALRRKTAAAPAWTPADEEELAQLRRKAQRELPTTVTPDGSFNTSDEDTPHESRDDFVIEKSIGKGAFGEVFLATSKQNGRSYAIKTIPRGKAGDERRALLAVKHPFVVRLRYWFDGPADTWLVMDYAPRGTLASHLERRSGRRLPIAHARLVSAELASALLALHAAGVVHRDVKPSNILVDGAISASRGAAAPSRHRCDSCSSDEVVGGFFFEFEAVRTESSDRDAPRRPRLRREARAPRNPVHEAAGRPREHFGSARFIL